MFPSAAIVLTGGRGRRLGGTDKAALQLGGRSLLERLLDVLSGLPAVVVGEPVTVPAPVRFTQERPLGGGPAAGTVAGLDMLLADRDVAADWDVAAGQAGAPYVAVLAVDQPGITAGTLRRLADAVDAARGRGAVLTDGGRRQYGASVVPLSALTRAASARDSWHGVPLHVLLDPVIGSEVAALGAEARDIDTPADLRWWQSRKTDSEET